MKSELFSISQKIDDLTINSVINKMNYFTSGKTPLETHSHSFNEIFAVVEGELNVKLSDGEIILPAGRICIIPVGVFHYIIPSENSNIICIRFDCLCNKQNSQLGLYANFNSLMNSDYPKVIIDEHFVTCKIFQQAYEELKNPTIYTDFYVKSLLTQAYINIYRELIKTEKQTELKQEKLQAMEGDSNIRLRIESLFFEYLSEKITAKDFAKILNYSERHLNRMINKFYGKSFKTALTDFRLERGAQLLINLDNSIEDIAHLCGYSSVKNFNIAFSKKFLITPKNYRNLKGKKEKS